MITLDQFNLLDNNQKMEALLGGFYLEMRFEDGLRVQLYKLEDFYAEVYYDTVKNVIVKAIGFKSNKILAKFIQL